MEKYSAFRDPGTGIQPFLTPVPPIGDYLLAKVSFPFRCILGAVRTLLVLVLGLIYLLLVEGVCAVFAPVPILHRCAAHVLTAVIARLVLLLVGVCWIPVEHVTRKRGRGSKGNTQWNPSAGDVIVSNWASWVEILWLAFRFNPVFILPVTEAIDIPAPSPSSTPITHTPGRRTGTGSANISSPSRAPSVRKSIIGFRRVSLLSMLSSTGHVPCYEAAAAENSLEDIRRTADRPIVLFPECTTSNGRGMLRFGHAFHGEIVPVKKYKLFIMCVRYDPPTGLTPTLTHSIPSSFINPLPHLFNLTTTVTPLTVSIRLLSPSESPSSPLFVLSEVISGSPIGDELSEACATLIAQIGKMKRTGMGWEDKVAFLDFYRGKRK